MVNLNLAKLAMKTNHHNRLLAFPAPTTSLPALSNGSVVLAGDENPLKEGKDNRKQEETEILLSS